MGPTQPISFCGAQVERTTINSVSIHPKLIEKARNNIYTFVTYGNKFNITLNKMNSSIDIYEVLRYVQKDLDVIAAGGSI
jgi:hypothetical protein